MVEGLDHLLEYLTVIGGGGLMTMLFSTPTAILAAGCFKEKKYVTGSLFAATASATILIGGFMIYNYFSLNS